LIEKVSKHHAGEEHRSNRNKKGMSNSPRVGGKGESCWAAENANIFGKASTRGKKKKRGRTKSAVGQRGGGHKEDPPVEGSEKKENPRKGRGQGLEERTLFFQDAGRAREERNSPTEKGIISLSTRGGGGN